MRHVLIVTALLAVATTALAQQAQPPADTPTGAGEIDVEFDRSTDFSRFTTFAWAPDLEPAKDATTHRLIVGAVERELIRKGLVKAGRIAMVPSQLLVSYWSMAEGKLKGSTRNRTSAVDPNDRQMVTTFEREQTGTLAVELLDAVSRAVVWRAKGSGLLESRTETQKELEGAVGRLLADFPPR